MSEQTNGLRVQMKIGFRTKQRGRKVLAAKKPSEAHQRPRQSVSRQARLLALAHRWQRLIDEGHVESQTEIARMMGLSKARVSQIMDLRWLCPLQQEQLLFAFLDSQ